MHYWKTLATHPTFKEREFVSFSDLQPSRYALSYIPESNMHAYSINVAFIALDSEKLGEHVNDAIHLDFGDNKFPYYLGNKKTKLDIDEEDLDDDDIQLDSRQSFLSNNQIIALKKYIPQSILSFLTE